ncbi:MAG: hypothetical protein ACOC5S_01260 [Acidobacteriota bacterium]
MSAHSIKGRWRIVPYILSAVVLLSGTSLAQQKKVEITAEKANVYLKPDISSLKIGVLKKGDVAVLASPIKIKTNWYYIYFSSENSDFTSSGYILESSLKKLFTVTKVLSIDEEKNQKNRYEYGAHFRNTRWGMNPKQVIFTEGQPISREESGKSETLKYESSFLDMNCLLVYRFSRNSLIGAKYCFLDKYPLGTPHIQDYHSLKKALTKKYGEPKQDLTQKEVPPEENNSNSNQVTNNSHRLFQKTCWETKETWICLNLYQNKEHIEMKLEFTHLNSSELRLNILSNSLSYFWQDFSNILFVSRKG